MRFFAVPADGPVCGMPPDGLYEQPVKRGTSHIRSTEMSRAWKTGTAGGFFAVTETDFPAGAAVCTSNMMVAQIFRRRFRFFLPTGKVLSPGAEQTKTDRF